MFRAAGEDSYIAFSRLQSTTAAMAENAVSSKLLVPFLGRSHREGYALAPVSRSEKTRRGGFIATLWQVDARAAFAVDCCRVLDCYRLRPPPPAPERCESHQVPLAIGARVH